MTTGTGQYRTELTFNGDSDVGQSRKHKPNQDSYDTYEHFCTDHDRLAAKGKLFVVADGMGGAAGGTEASTMAVDVVFRTYYDDPDLDVMASLERAIQAANTQIQQHGRANPELRGLGTTIVVAVIRGRTLVVGNVGDSRAYLLRNGELRQLSLDHTMVQEQVREGLLTPEEALTHPRRHVLSRNLGYRPKAGPEFVTETLSSGDSILLCSDGLWGTVDDDELAVVLRQHRGDAAVQTLIDQANERGGPDNISAIVIHVDSVAPAATSVSTDRRQAGAAASAITEEVQADPPASPPAQAQTEEHIPSPARAAATAAGIMTAGTGGRAESQREQPRWNTAVMVVVMLLLIGLGVYLVFTFFAASSATSQNIVPVETRAGISFQKVGTLQPGEGPIAAVALSDKADFLALGSAQGQITLVRATSHATEATLGGSNQKLSSLAFSQDGRWLGAGLADGTVQIWELSTRDPRRPSYELRHTVEGPPRPIKSVTFASNMRLTTADTDATVKLWELGNTAPLDSFGAPQANIQAVAVSPNGQTLVVVEPGGTVTVWGAQDALRTVYGHQGEVPAVAVTSDGTRLAIVEPDGTITLTSWNDHKTLGQIKDYSNKGRISSIAFTPGDKFLVVAQTAGPVEWWAITEADPNPPVSNATGEASAA